MADRNPGSPDPRGSRQKADRGQAAQRSGEKQGSSMAPGDRAEPNKEIQGAIPGQTGGTQPGARSTDARSDPERSRGGPMGPGGRERR